MDFNFWLTNLIIPVLIFLSRIVDVSFGTVRIILISKGYKKIAPLIGFFEVLIWLIAIKQIMSNLSSPISYIAYAAGFSTGTYVGMIIENKLSLGNAIIRVVTQREGLRLVNYLNTHQYGATYMDALGSRGKVQIIFTIVKKQDLNHVISIIKQFNPQAFYTVENVQSVNAGTFPNKSKSGFFKLRKGK